MNWKTIEHNELAEDFWPEYVDGVLKAVEVDIDGKTYKILCEFGSLSLLTRACANDDIKVGGTK